MIITFNNNLIEIFFLQKVEITQFSENIKSYCTI